MDMYVSRCDTLRTSLHLYNIMAKNAQFRFMEMLNSDSGKYQTHTGTLIFKRGGAVRELYFQKWLFYKRQKVAVEML